MSNRRWLELLNALAPPADTPDTLRPRPTMDASGRQRLLNELEGMVHKLATSHGVPVLELQADETREVVQGVMRTILMPEEAARLRSLQSIEASVALLVRNAALHLANTQERLSRTLRVPLVNVPPAGASGRSIAEARLEWLRTEVKRLSERDHALLELRFETGLPIAEIARQTGSSYSAVAVRLFLLVRRLRAGLEPAL